MTGEKLEINLFGASRIRVGGEGGKEISGAKHKALIALLATAYGGRRTRKYLQGILWQTAAHDGGGQNLRRALSDLKKELGKVDYDRFITANHSEVKLNLKEIEFISDWRHGPFLEGLQIKESAFADWIEECRSNPWRVSMNIGAVLSADSQPSKLFVSVIPFTLDAGDPDHAILGDILSRDIARSLARSRFLSVTSPLSASQFVRQEASFMQLRDQLKSDYAVLGSIRSDGSRVNLDVDFYNVSNNQLMWNRSFEWVQFEEQQNNSKMITEVVRAIGRSVVRETIDATASMEIERIDDHRLLTSGITLMHRKKQMNFIKGRQMIMEALSRNQNCAELYAWVAKWHVLNVLNGWSEDLAEDKKRALEQTEKALDIDPECPFSLTMDGFVKSYLLDKHEEAMMRFEAALAINSNESLAWLLSGSLMLRAGNAASAVERTEKAYELSPLDPFGYFYDSVRSLAHFAAGNYETAIQLADRAYQDNPRFVPTLRARLVALYALERFEEAKGVAEELLQLQPTFTVNEFNRTNNTTQQNFAPLMAEAFKESGIPIS